MNGSKISFKDSNGHQRTIRASYGIMNVLQLRHLAALKHHYSSTIYRSITAPRGRYREGTPRLGEAELTSMVIQVLTACVRDAVNTSDMCVTVICSVCGALMIFCDCPHPKPPPREIQARYSLIILTVYVTVYVTVAMLNTSDSVPLTLRFFDGDEFLRDYGEGEITGVGTGGRWGVVYLL